MMSLTVNLQELRAIKGDKGDTGAQGPPGRTVYRIQGILLI